jgi:hypothetical protein
VPVRARSAEAEEEHTSLATTTHHTRSELTRMPAEAAGCGRLLTLADARKARAALRLEAAAVAARRAGSASTARAAKHRLRLAYRVNERKGRCERRRPTLASDAAIWRDDDADDDDSVGPTPRAGRGRRKTAKVPEPKPSPYEVARTARMEHNARTLACLVGGALRLAAPRRTLRPRRLRVRAGMVSGYHVALHTAALRKAAVQLYAPLVCCEKSGSCPGFGRGDLVRMLKVAGQRKGYAVVYEMHELSCVHLVADVVGKSVQGGYRALVGQVPVTCFVAFRSVVDAFAVAARNGAQSFGAKTAELRFASLKHLQVTRLHRGLRERSDAIQFGPVFISASDSSSGCKWGEGGG